MSTGPLFPRHSPGELDADQRKVYDAILSSRGGAQRDPLLMDAAGRLEGPFGAMVAAPNVGLPLQDLGSAIRYRGTLPDRLRELCILTVAAVERCDYEWIVHEPLARRAGATQAQLLLAETGNEHEPTTMSTSDGLIVLTAYEIAVHGQVSGGQRFTQAVSPELLIEITVLVGYYRTLAQLLRILEVPLPSSALPRF